jgi:hypothetical protein
MKRLIFIAAAYLLIAGCGNQGVSKNDVISKNDSLTVKLVQKDSTIMAYIKSINSIQGSIDTLMKEAKILKIHGEGTAADTTNIIKEIKEIGMLMVKNNKELVTLQRKLKNSGIQNEELVDLGENLSKQLNEKDSEIAVMQQTIIKTKASLNTLVQQFNDSLTIINQERAQIGVMTVEKNTAYYIVGTEKDLKDKGIIVNKGGVIGLGHVPQFSQSANTSGFTKADITTLHEIQLGGSFVSLVTVHPEKAYRVTRTSPDKIIITDPDDFWSKSKYLVAIVK